VNGRAYGPPRPLHHGVATLTVPARSVSYGVAYRVSYRVSYRGDVYYKGSIAAGA
jgi:hypothetical protein